MKGFLSGFLVAVSIASAEANVVRHTLADGGIYLHASLLREDLPLLAKEVVPGKTVILDLRATAAGEEETGALLGLFGKVGKDSGNVRLVLLNDDTAAALKEAFGNEVGDTVTLGPAHGQGSYDVAVETPLAEDATAVKALETGEGLALWTTETVDKERVDEASLVAAKAPPPEAPAEAPTPLPKKTGHPIDRVLQRALQLAVAAKVNGK